MKYLLTDGNVIIATQDYIAENYPDAELLPNPILPDPVQQAPSKVTMRQARLALLGAGLLSQVDAALTALEEPMRTAALIEWNYSSEVHRNKPFIDMLGESLGLDDEAIDNLFVAAAGIE